MPEIALKNITPCHG